MSERSNKGMKLTKLSSAPGQTEAPPSARQRFALVRTASQLIPGVQHARLVAGASPDAREFERSADVVGSGAWTLRQADEK